MSSYLFATFFFLFHVCVWQCLWRSNVCLGIVCVFVACFSWRHCTIIYRVIRVLGVFLDAICDIVGHGRWCVPSHGELQQPWTSHIDPHSPCFKHPPPLIHAHPLKCVVPSHWLALSLAKYGLWGKSTPARRRRVHILCEQRLCWLGGATHQEACVYRVEIGMYSQLISGCSSCLELKVIMYAIGTPFSQS